MNNKSIDIVIPSILRNSAIHFILFISLMIFAPNSFAVITYIPGAGGVSVANESDLANISLFGGQAGDCRASDMDGSSTCDSCVGLLDTVPDLCNPGGLGVSCNQHNVYDNLYITIKFKSDQAYTASHKPVYQFSSKVVTVFEDEDAATKNLAIPAGAIITAKVQWSTLASYIQTEGMNDGFSETISIGMSKDGSEFADKMSIKISYRLIDNSTATGAAGFHADCTTNATAAADDEGFCYFEATRGDEKIYIENMDANVKYDSALSDKTNGAMEYKSVRMYYAPDDGTGNFCLIHPADAAYRDLPYSKEKHEISDNRVDGLTNGQPYVFLLANVDSAGNVSYFSDPMALLDGVQSATPDAVIGLLDGKKCFIATAAFGSEMDPHVDELRQFRNQFLLPHGWGRAFTKFYYKFSPPIADVIKKSDSLRFLTRLVLWPVVFAVELFMNPPLFTLFLLVVLLFVLRRYWLRPVDSRLKISKSGKSLLGLFILATVLIFSFKTFAQVNYLPPTAKKTPVQKSTVENNEEVDSDDSEVAEKETQEDELDDEVTDAEEVDVVDKNAETDEVDGDTEVSNDQSTAETPQNPAIINGLSKTQQQAPSVGSNRLSETESAVDDKPIFVKPVGPTAGGTLRVPHPNAGKGLIRIEKDGSYQYGIKKSEKSKAISVRFGTMTPPNILAGTTTAVDSTEDFSSMYGDKDLFAVNFDYEWQPFSSFGTIGLQLGTGFMTATGTGVFESDGAEAKEKYTLYIIPLTANVVYRLNYFSRQWFVPYVKGGGSYYGLVEMRDDSKSPSVFAAPAVGGGGGVHVSISRIDPKSSFTLDRDYGISDMWLTLEYMKMVGLNKDTDFSSDSLQFGVTVDF